MSQISKWIESFHRDGFLVIPSVLTREQCYVLKNDLDTKLKEIGPIKTKLVLKRMFEHSPANLELFWQEPVVTFAEQLIADTGRVGQHKELNLKDYISKTADEVHVIHNNSYKIIAGRDGLGKSSWHQDDTPHFTTLDGKPATNIKLNVLAMTCLYYLTDVPDDSYGPTQFIRGSHLFGQYCNDDITGHEKKIASALGPAGTCVIINNQTWHRGSPNSSGQDRYCTQVTYAKRLVGHKYGNFIDYQLPEHIASEVTDPRKKRLLGFLGHGAYG